MIAFARDTLAPLPHAPTLTATRRQGNGHFAIPQGTRIFALIDVCQLDDVGCMAGAHVSSRFLDSINLCIHHQHWQYHGAWGSGVKRSKKEVG